MDDLLKLAERCEQATGPDRELDTGIAKALGLTDQRTHMSPQGLGYVDRNQWAVARVERYTASLDAAITLVLEEYRRSNLYEAEPQNRSTLGWLEYATLQPRSGGHHIIAAAATPALALCAAALRARASTPSPNDASEQVGS